MFLVIACLVIPDLTQASESFTLVSTIAFSSIRDNPTGNPFLAAEIYLINPDGTNPRRLTDNAQGDAFPVLSPDGRRSSSTATGSRPSCAMGSLASTSTTCS